MPVGHNQRRAIIELRDQQVWRETVYWAEPFGAPEWRSSWVRGQGDAD